MSSVSASNRLYAGEVTDFLDAMECVDQMCLGELQFTERYAREFPESDNTSLRESLQAFRNAAANARAEYYETIKQAEIALAKKWQQSEDEDLRNIGEALESGDYSNLAI